MSLDRVSSVEFKKLSCHYGDFRGIDPYLRGGMADRDHDSPYQCPSPDPPSRIRSAGRAPGDPG